MTLMSVCMSVGSWVALSVMISYKGGKLHFQAPIRALVKHCFELITFTQGCCNNITFGDSSFGYYETVAGGSGAGPSWDGRSGVHVHMTNTR